VDHRLAGQRLFDPELKNARRAKASWLQLTTVPALTGMCICSRKCSAMRLYGTIWYWDM
jgi:hypothetical protein